jgi:hypothetical protein
MGNMTPETKISEAQRWVNAHFEEFGKCTGIYHNWRYKDTTQLRSGEFLDGSSASVFVCNKCCKIKNATLTLTMQGFFKELIAK